MIRLSAGTAAALGLKKIRMDADPTTAYLSMGKNVPGSVLCPQAHGAGIKAAGKDYLPAFAWRKRKGIRRAAENGLKRVCIQSVRQEKSAKLF